MTHRIILEALFLKHMTSVNFLLFTKRRKTYYTVKPTAVKSVLLF